VLEGKIGKKVWLETCTLIRKPCGGGLFEWKL
jgi:hypothetical protein